ncbi:MAG: hypothetical protein ACI8X5_001911 [Planctomycetota bacterium]|jgi:uncharacterized protein (UPF0261 family)
MHVLLLVTCDTKGREATWLKRELSGLGVDARIVDCGSLGEPYGPADISCEEVFHAAGTTRSAMLLKGDRGSSVEAAARGATAIALQTLANGELAGVLSIGGSAGTTIGTTAMRALPLGLPKLMVSTHASGNMRPYIEGHDIMVLNSVVDFAGMNRISRKVLGNAVRAMAGMVLKGNAEEKPQLDLPLVAITMFGVTTPCVEQASAVLQDAGYEVLVFHATGSGGESFEATARSGMLAGVLDITTTELADEVVGGILSAGPTRLTAAGEMGLPQVVSVGATDMVNFGARSSVPPAFIDRLFVEHNANATLMRTTSAECSLIGAELARKLADARGPRAILLPARGVSALDREGAPFNDSIARAALFAAIEENRGATECDTLNFHINDPEFAQAAAEKLLELMQNG